MILSPEYSEYLLISKARPVSPDVEDMVYPFVDHAGPRGPEEEITLGRVRRGPNRVFYFGEKHGVGDAVPLPARPGFDDTSG